MAINRKTAPSGRHNRKPRKSRNDTPPKTVCRVPEHGTGETRSRNSAGTEPSIENSAVRTIAVIKNVDTNQFSLMLDFRTIEPKRKSIFIERSRRNEPGKVTLELLNEGADLPPDRKEAIAIVSLALALDPPKIIKVTSITGWRDDRFILPTCAFGDFDEPINYVNGVPLPDGLGARSGDHQAWKTALETGCANSDILIFVLALGLTGPFMKLVGLDESYARIWVTGDHAAAWVWSLLASTPSLNLTPSTSFDNW